MYKKYNLYYRFQTLINYRYIYITIILLLQFFKFMYHAVSA